MGYQGISFSKLVSPKVKNLNESEADFDRWERECSREHIALIDNGATCDDTWEFVERKIKERYGAKLAVVDIKCTDEVLAANNTTMQEVLDELTKRSDNLKEFQHFIQNSFLSSYIIYNNIDRLL